MTHSFNPDGWRSCARLSKLETCSPKAHNCFCMHGRNGTEPCLFSDMRAALCTCFPKRGLPASDTVHTLIRGRSRETCPEPTKPPLFHCTSRRPVKILAVITAARLAGVTHIIEEGRYGGLSALMYALHGFKVHGALTNIARPVLMNAQPASGPHTHG